MAIYYGPPAIFGIPEKQKAITGLPSGRTKLRLSHEDFAEVEVETPDGIRVFYLEDKGDHWHAFVEKETNQTN